MRRKDIIDILCEFQVIHKKDLEDYGEIDFANKKIYISPQLPDARRDSVIHELYHAYDFLKRKPVNESTVITRSRRMFKQLYGKAKKR